MRKLLLIVGIGTSSVLIAVVAVMYSQLEVPAPTGIHAVGRETHLWEDHSRTESSSGDVQPRRVGVVLWYPAEQDTGRPAPYVPDLDALSEGLASSGELSRLQVFGLRFVRDPARQGASLPESATPYPVVLLSPGNATNVEFYAAFAEELASHGYVVVGVNHPHQVTAMLLSDGRVAVYPGDAPPADEATRIEAAISRVDERVRDMRFVLERLAAEPGTVLADRLDLARVGAMGHSLGGIAAAEFCASPGSVVACLNVDGLQAGGPFGVRPELRPPSKPFMFLTKEVALHPTLAAAFERADARPYRVVVPGAEHGEFADGPMFRTNLWPFGTSARDVMTVSRGFARAFFDMHLRGVEGATLGEVDAPTDVYVYGYPLQQR